MRAAYGRGRRGTLASTSLWEGCGANSVRISGEREGWVCGVRVRVESRSRSAPHVSSAQCGYSNVCALRRTPSPPSFLGKASRVTIAFHLAWGNGNVLDGVVDGDWKGSPLMRT